MPVNTMAMPCSSAAAMTSSSRMLPPGWIDGRDAAFGDDVDAVAEREEGIRGQRPSRRASRPAFFALSAAMRARIHAAHLPGADAEGHAVAREHDGVGLHELGHVPGEQQVVQLGRASGCASLTTLQVAARRRSHVGGLHQQAAADALHLEAVQRPSARVGHREHAHVLLAPRAPAARRVERRRDHHFDELLSRSPRRSRASSGRLKAMMPPNAEVGSVA